MDGTLAVLAEVTRLRKLELARRDFAANASHELRTPITSIRGFAETLRNQTVHDPERSARFLDIILRQAGRLEALIEDLLFIATLESLGEAKAILLERMPIKPLVDAAATTCRPAAEKKDIRILTRCEPDLIAPANAEILERALTNLVDNAVKFSPEGSTVTVTAKRDGDMALLSVADQGPGIAPEDQKRIFERFYRVDKSRSRREGGTGLGLSIVKHAALAHKGNAGLTSAPGTGSVFTITLPLACPPCED